jgi:hypothetical protein
VVIVKEKIQIRRHTKSADNDGGAERIGSLRSRGHGSPSCRNRAERVSYRRGHEYRAL